MCDFKGRDEKEIVRYIITRLREMTDNDEYTLEEYMLILDTLSSNRKLENLLKKARDK